MGIQFLIETRIIMKFLVVLALAAIASAEPEAEAKADPAYWYGNQWGGRPAYYGNWGYQSYGSPFWGGFYNRGYGYWKRDADAKPNAEADSAFLYRTYFNSPYYTQYMNNQHTMMSSNMNQMNNMNQMHQVNNMNQMNKAYTYAVPWAYNYGYQQAP